MSAKTPTESKIFTRYYEAGHRAFQGHFPNNPILPGVFYFREIRSLLPSAMTAGSYVIKQAKFIKMVGPNTQLFYQIGQRPAADADKTEVTAIVKNAAEEMVAKIQFIVKAEGRNAG